MSTVLDCIKHVAFKMQFTIILAHWWLKINYLLLNKSRWMGLINENQLFIVNNLILNL